MRARALLLCLLPSLFLTTPLWADNLLQDPNFATVGQEGSPWTGTLQEGGQTEAARAADGTTSALRLRAAALEQRLTLPAGLFELTVEAIGQGELALSVAHAGQRYQSFGRDWGTCGYLFETAGGETAITLRVSVSGTLTSAALQPATPEQQRAWDRSQEDLRHFGFVLQSPQRPAPGAAPLTLDGQVRSLEAMTRKAVLDEPRMNTHWAQNVDRLVNWLGDHGFSRVDGCAVADWLAERIKQGDAYGSVLVMPRGKTPVTILEGPEQEPRWLAYLRAGGRIVHAGDLPFYNSEMPTVAPQPWASYEQRGLSLLGLRPGWNSPYWGDNSPPVTRTEQAKAWGIELMDGPVTGMPVESISIPFGVYTVAATGRRGASCWFKNVRPDMPWSGLVKLQQIFNAGNDTALRDIWRAAHYVGKPVEVPALPPAFVTEQPRLVVETQAGGMSGRREFVRGESVALRVTPAPELQAQAVRFELVYAGDVLHVEQAGVATLVEGQPPGASFVLDTSPYTYGDYELRFFAVQGDEYVAEVSENTGIRYVFPRCFNWQIWHGPGPNPLRTDLEFADIRAAGMELYLISSSPQGVDCCVRHGLGFSVRFQPDLMRGKPVTFEKNPEYFRLDNEGRPIRLGYSGDRPTHNLSHPEIRENVRIAMREAVRSVAGVPAFRPYVLCNDDYWTYYGGDYSAHVLEAFRTDTGLQAPRQMIKPEAYGAIPDAQPWVTWFDWTLRNVNAAFNRAETQGAMEARPDVRVGPIPGGHIVSLWQPAEYPVYAFGEGGFNLICFYYYNMFWEPLISTTFWMEIARMGNRDLPQWNMPDTFMSAGYTRNSLFHFLAGGVRGLAYFRYDERNASTWPEFRHLGTVVNRIGPVQARINPARRTLGMLTSFTSNCFDPLHARVQAFGYHNLLQGHFDVEMFAEQEVLTGRASQYDAILLHNVQYLTQLVYDALAAYAAAGGKLLLDASIPFDIPGALRLPVDVGRGEKRAQSLPPEGAPASPPGLPDYGNPERIRVIQHALAPHLQPWFDCDDVKVAGWRFEYGGVPYHWFVNVHDGKEYTFCRERQGMVGANTPEKTRELRDWEAAEMAQGPYRATIRLRALPGAVPYDLVGMTRVPCKRLPDGRWELSLTMERFGGMLIAWLPQEVVSVRLTAPASIHLNRPFRATATVLGTAPLPGVLAVDFQLTDPEGRSSPVSGTRAAEQGQALFEWRPAVNDPPGEWTLTATELATGRSARRALRVLQ